MGRAFLSRWALPVSLALNVFLVTVLVIREPGPPPGGRDGGPPSPLHIAERLAADLSAADAAVLRAAIARHSQEVERRHRIWTGLPARIGAALAAPTLDVEGLRAILAEGREAHAAMDDAVAQVIIEASTAMSAEGRQAVARWRPPHPPRGGPPPPR